jgi:APA family basic amino acid/polyamine antiporter
VTALAILGDVKLTWSFSAFTVLGYYAITNLAALQLPASQRLYPRWVSWLGIGACLFLAFWVEPAVWMTGLALIAAGLLWHVARARPAKP